LIESNNFYNITKQIAPSLIEKPQSFRTDQSSKTFAKEMASAYHKIQTEIALKEKQRVTSYEKPLENSENENLSAQDFINEKAYLFKSTKNVYDHNAKLQGIKSYESSFATHVAAPLDYKVNYRPKQMQENPIYYNFLRSDQNPYNSAIKMMQAQKAYEPFKLSA
jgi:hypothetical protein